MDAINEDTRANAIDQFGAEEAQTADSFLNMSGDGSEGDDDFAPTPAQQSVPVRILIMHVDLTILDLRLIYLLLHLVMLCIEVEPVERETPSDQKLEGRQVVTEVDAEGCPCAPEAASTKFVAQCGVVVRARIPITTRLWKSSNPEEQQHVVPHTRRKCYGQN